MLRFGGRLLNNTAVSAGACVQQTRGIRPRKPPFSGIAKTKLFKIPKRTEHPPDEYAEIRRLSNQHKLYMKSISHFCKEENMTHATGSAEATEEVDAEEVEWQQSLIRIEQWNKEVEDKRNMRLTAERQAKEEEIRERIQEEERNRQLRLQEIDEIVRREKERFKSYITPENIDKAIAECLENVKDFNYSVDVRGRKYVGRFVNESGVVDLPETAAENEDESLPPLFQSSPIDSGFLSRK